MAPSSPTGTRRCPFCGQLVAIRLNRCPFCREEFQDVPSVRRVHNEGPAQIRRGLLYILLAAIIHYFAAGYSGFQLPITVPAFVTAYLTPLLFLGGTGFAVYGLYRYLRS